jgi:hypothetical protein
LPVRVPSALDPSNDPVLPDDLRIPTCRELGCAHLGFIIDVHDPEPLAVALGPLEVVQERPEEIAADVEPFGKSPVELDKVYP